MSQFYKITEAAPLGEPWDSHGKQNQTYWCKVEGEELAVSISKQVGNTLSPGQHVYGDLMKAKSQKGTDYWKFKGAMVPEGVQRPTDEAAPAGAQGYAEQWASKQPDLIPQWFMPFGNMIMAMHKQMFGEADTPAKPEPVDDPGTQDLLDKMFPKDEPASEEPEL